MTPIMVVIVSQVWPGGERAAWIKSIGVALGFVGIVVLVSPAFAGQGTSNPWALLATMAAPLCYGIALNLMRRFDGMDRTVLTAWSLMLGTAILVPVALGREGMPVITLAQTWVALAILGGVLTAGAFILLFWLIPRVGGTTASTITLIAPISAVLLGAWLLGEVVTAPQLTGMGIILTGLLFVEGGSACCGGASPTRPRPGGAIINQMVEYAGTRRIPAPGRVRSGGILTHRKFIRLFSAS